MGNYVKCLYKFLLIPLFYFSVFEDAIWWPSCLDRDALNNVDAPGCGTSVVRGPTGHK